MEESDIIELEEEKKKDKKEPKNKRIKKEKKEKKNKNNTVKEPEIFNSEKWNEFYDILDYKYQLGNCIFLVDDDYFYRFPKKFICYGIDNSEFSTNNLNEETLISKIVEATKSFDNNIPDSILSNLLNYDLKKKQKKEENKKSKSGEKKD